ncbi:unnamed protein product [Linum tenue]|uniref:U3 small nucleolar RNA-associated protein 6 n=1 Tax=Linum tenue TaxID=586396 RepID=A0AAV0R6S4_9ROSI|nr:unnamed protein product [Linum tenue]
MADTVQYRLERMVEELDDLERRGLFTRRRSVARDLDKKKDNKRTKLSVSDFAGVSRIVEIYRLAVLRYKGDVDLWLRYLEFCRERSNGRMFHPKVPGVWIYAAAWEFDHNLNVAAARALMQSGLRVCPTSDDLWVEYLRMELTYLNKLKSRKVALGEGRGSLAVYSGAVEALPSSFSLRERFLEILEATDLAYSEDMRERILSDMKRDFSKDPKYWEWLARLELRHSQSSQGISDDLMLEQLQKAVKVQIPINSTHLMISKSQELLNI